jgi:hypothetical protein
MNERREWSEGELTAYVVRAIALVLLVTIAGCVPCCVYRDYQRANALLQGVDALGVACVYGQSDSTDACALAAATHP